MRFERKDLSSSGGKILDIHFKNRSKTEKKAGEWKRKAQMEDNSQ